MPEIRYWTDDPRPAHGLTPFGYFDGDPIFLSDAPRVAKWCARRLGYPIVDVELIDENFYACFEESTAEFSAQVNRANIRNNYWDLLGKSSDVSYNGVIIQPSINDIVLLAEAYLDAAGYGPNVKWYTGSLDVKMDQQKYDLAEWANTNIGQGERIEIIKLYHYAMPAMSQFFDSGFYGGNQLLSEFGWQANFPGAQFLMFPIYSDLLMIQELEFNDQVRRSPYSFDLNGNMLTLMPVPKRDAKVWFDYRIVSEKNYQPNTANSGSTMSDISNMNYRQVDYREINAPGKQWIKEFTYALAKELLGMIRSKYQAIPNPDGDISMDGETLRTEAATLKEALLTQLTALLDETSRKARYEQRQAETEMLNSVLNSVPLSIYIK